MFLTALELYTGNLSQQLHFYTHTLGLPLRQHTKDSFTVQAGMTLLTFRISTQKPLHYHFAFTIPLNTWKQAKIWLQTRTILLKSSDEDEFVNAQMRTHSYYFADPAGNILEYIARDDLPTTQEDHFDQQALLSISEIGLVVDDVATMVQQLKRQLGIEVYRDSHSEKFAQLGDINGVLILVQKGRLWAPDERQPAVVSPVHVSISGTLAQQITLESYPYVLEIVPLNH